MWIAILIFYLPDDYLLLAIFGTVIAKSQISQIKVTATGSLFNLKISAGILKY